MDTVFWLYILSGIYCKEKKNYTGASNIGWFGRFVVSSISVVVILKWLCVYFRIEKISKEIYWYCWEAGSHCERKETSIWNAGRGGRTCSVGFDWKYQSQFKICFRKKEYFLALKRPRNNNTPNNNEHTKSPDLGF